MAEESDIFAEARLQEERLLEQLAASPTVDVVGVVAPMGASGGRFRSDELWTLTFTFDAWRDEAGDIQTRPLTIRRKVTHEELDSLSGQITPYIVMRINARVVADSPLQGPQALIEALVGIETSDAELNEYANQLRKPVTYQDPVFGTFTLDRRVYWFTNDVVWGRNPITLNLSAREPAEVRKALKTAHSLWESQDTWSRRINDYAVQELLPLKNGNWLDEDEAELNADQFKDRMTLESIIVYPDGSFEFWHNDGDLFWGHLIQITGSISEGPTSADIPG